MRRFVLSLLLVLTAGSAFAQTTAFPPDLPDAQPVPARRLVVKAEPTPMAKPAVKPKKAVAKPVAGLTLHLMDADTGEVLATAVEPLELAIPTLPAKPRRIEGRIA